MKQRGKAAKSSKSESTGPAENGAPSWLDRVKEQPVGDAGLRAQDPDFWSSPESRPDVEDQSPAEAPAEPEAAAPQESVEPTDAPHAPAAVEVPFEFSDDEAHKAPMTDSNLGSQRPVLAEERMWNVNPSTDLGDLVRGIPEQSPGPAFETSVGLSVGGLRQAALEMARRDADAGLPALDATGRSEAEQELSQRCHSLFADWSARERERLNNQVAVQEGRVTEALGEVSLEVDRFERVTSELFRLQRRLEMNRSHVEATIEEQHAEEQKQSGHGEQPQSAETRKKSGVAGSGSRAFKSHWYALAISFLGIVEFLANAPVFGALLPRDPLTEQQIRFVSETSEGWLAGAQRVVSQFILRPDAAILAAGVITFLVVLAHFFGHSLRSLLFQRSAERSGDTLGTRSPMEFIVPMLFSGLGLALVLGVLFEARVTLGEVSAVRFVQDSSKIEEMRRDASWLRVDGNLVSANEQTNRADDLEALAKEQREYAESMSGLSFPIFLLNTTLVLVAILAAYFHMRDPRKDRFNEHPWERQRRDLVQLGDSVQARIARGMGQMVQSLGEYRGMLSEKPLKEGPALAHQLEATVVAYRAENGRLRGLDPREISAFAEPVKLDIEVAAKHAADMRVQDPSYYEAERDRLTERYERVRARFTEEATSW
ncbi:MAG: hypothetical protein OEM23_00570 [Gemmatimonadota bacterium]|nr:hypothetical protein [Gemmatimonadota bacterium]MDH3426901.1 hypothetical protein [Gemmatimonadota bacterium]